MNPPQNLQGIFAVWKPKGPSSYDVIRALKNILSEKKIGHAGTLDPLASGIMVIAAGRDATKRIAEEVAKEKEYLAGLRLGMRSTTDDAEGMKTKTLPERRTTLREIEKALSPFIGEIEQIPPVWSAVKIQGMEAYKRARMGEAPEMKPRRVAIKSIKVESFRWPYLSLRVTTGPGVYIRALARDLGEKLGTGAYLSNLERSRVGDFTKEGAYVLPSVRSSIRPKK